MSIMLTGASVLNLRGWLRAGVHRCLVRLRQGLAVVYTIDAGGDKTSAKVKHRTHAYHGAGLREFTHGFSSRDQMSRSWMARACQGKHDMSALTPSIRPLTSPRGVGLHLSRSSCPRATWGSRPSRECRNLDRTVVHGCGGGGCQSALSRFLYADAMTSLSPFLTGLLTRCMKSSLLKR